MLQHGPRSNEGKQKLKYKGLYALLAPKLCHSYNFGPLLKKITLQHSSPYNFDMVKAMWLVTYVI